MELVRSANLALRFLLELGGIAALGVWGFQLDRNGALRWVAGIGAPLVLIVVWALAVAPNNGNALGAATKMWIGTALLAAAAGALAAAGRTGLASAFALTVVANAVLMQVWGQ